MSAPEDSIEFLTNGLVARIAAAETRAIEAERRAAFNAEGWELANREAEALVVQRDDNAARAEAAEAALRLHLDAYGDDHAAWCGTEGGWDCTCGRAALSRTEEPLSITYEPSGIRKLGEDPDVNDLGLGV